MRGPHKVTGHHYVKTFKTMWENKMAMIQKIANTDIKNTDVSLFGGKEIFDPLVLYAKPKEVFVPPVPNDPQWLDPNIEWDPRKESVYWNDKAIHVMNSGVKFLEGVKQASILSKCQVIQGLPPAIMYLLSSQSRTDYQDLLVQRIILQSQKWDPTQVHLPRKIYAEQPGRRYPREWSIPDSRSRSTLTRELIRLCGSLSRHLPHIRDRRHLADHFLSAHYTLNDEHDIAFHEYLPYVLTSNVPLPCFADKDAVEGTTSYSIPDMWPVDPIVDLELGNMYCSHSSTGFVTSYSHGHIQTIFVHHDEDLSPDISGSVALMYCFGATLAQAHHLYGKETKILPKPVTVQCIGHSCTSFNYVFFQLNTLDYSTGEGVKNIAWIDAGNSVCTRHLPKPWIWEKYPERKFTDYVPETFDKFLAAYQYGANI